MIQYTKMLLKKDDIKKMDYENKLRKDSNRIGITLIIAYFSQTIVLSMLLSYINILGFYNVYDYSNGFYGYDPIAYYLITATATIICLALPFLILLKIQNVDINTTLPFNKVGKKNLIAMVFLGLAVCTISNLTTSSFSLIAEKFGHTFASYDISYDNNPLVIFMMFLCVAFLPALIEEFVFRGVILGALRKYGDFFAIVISAILFATMHSTLLQVPFALSVGLVLAFVTVKSNSLLPAILIHFTNNFLSVLNTALYQSSHDIIATTIWYITFIVFIMGGLYAIKYLHDKANFFNIDNNVEMAITSKRRFEVFAKSPAMTICIIVLIVNVIYMTVAR